jgi:hypothetical protein
VESLQPFDFVAECLNVVDTDAGQGKHALAAERGVCPDLAKVSGVAAFIKIKVLRHRSTGPLVC